MTYYPDLTPYEYTVQDAPALNIGWLAKGNEFPTGDVGPDVVDALIRHAAAPVNVMRGVHDCEFCEAESPQTVWTADGSVSAWLGFSEIHVSGTDGIRYAAPTLIVHYVTEHDYLPPAEFIDALMGPSGWSKKSPFESVSDRLSARIATLPIRSQVALFGCAAEALAPRYFDWCTDSETGPEVEIFTAALADMRLLALGSHALPGRTMLEAIELAAPGEPSDSEWFTAAQDSWICLDSALRIAFREFTGRDATWYLLEPIFQAASYRLFGLHDVGSDHQGVAESIVLNDERVEAAIASIEKAIAILAEAPGSDAELHKVLTEIRHIAP